MGEGREEGGWENTEELKEDDREFVHFLFFSLFQVYSL